MGNPLDNMEESPLVYADSGLPVKETTSLASIAISMKRIADALDKIQEDFHWGIENGAFGS